MQTMQTSWDLKTFQLTLFPSPLYCLFTSADGNANIATFLGLRNSSINYVPFPLYCIFTSGDGNANIATFLGLRKFSINSFHTILFTSLLIWKAMPKLQPSWDLKTFKSTPFIPFFNFLTSGEGNANIATFLGLRNFSINYIPFPLYCLFTSEDGNANIATLQSF